MRAHRRNPEAVAIQRIDGGKRREEDRARDARVVASARMSTAVMIMAVPANDRVRHMEGMLDAIRDQLTAALDPAGASSIIASKAQQAIVSGVTANARAEQLFARREA
ncbi:MAG: hypothetical protein ACRED4_06075 [Brevundimonas sp.]